MSQHTTGPWTLGEGYNSATVQGSKMFVVTVESPAMRICGALGLKAEQASANARLIAAALDLLEALKAVDSGQSKLNARLRFIVKAAIAKAEGRP